MAFAKIPSKQAVYTLGQLYGELLGKRGRKLTDTPELRANIEHVAATILLLDPSADLAAIKPIRRNYMSRVVPRGQCFRDALQVMRTANGPLTAPEIASRILTARGIQTTRWNVKSTANAVRTALCNHEGKTVMRANIGKPALWKIIG